MTQPSLYPEWLESFWKNNALRALKKPTQTAEESLLALEAPIRKLSDYFTKNRPSAFVDYTKGDGLLAYGLFFYPQSFARIRFPLSEIVDYRNWKPDEGTHALKILDLGAGLGPASLSAGLFLYERFKKPIDITAIDHSPEALEIFSSIAATVPEVPIVLKTHCLTLQITKLNEKITELFDWVIASFSLNEFLAGKDLCAQLAFLENLKSLLKPNGGLLILEPALQETAISLQQLADLAIQKTLFYRWGPGASASPFPIEGASSKRWPHEVRLWRPPISLEYLNRRLFRSVGELKFHFTALGSSPLSYSTPPLPPLNCRLTSPMALMKGRWMWQGLSTDGNIYHYDMPTRHQSKEETRQIEKIERGDILYFQRCLPQKTPRHFRLEKAADISYHFHPIP